MRPAHGSTVFFMLVSLPAVTAPGQNVRAALMPIAETICAGVRFKHAPRRDRRRERAQGGVMPAVFAHARPADFAKTHFDFVGDDRGENQILAAQAFAFAQAPAARR